jgi:hypothetical protein
VLEIAAFIQQCMAEESVAIGVADECSFRMQEAYKYEQQISFVEWEDLKLLIDFLFIVWRTKAKDFRKVFPCV